MSTNPSIDDAVMDTTNVAQHLAHIADEVTFATEPQLAAALLEGAHAAGVRAAFVTGDEVYGGRELRTRIRALGLGYVPAVHSSTTVATHAGRTVTVKDAAGLIPANAWMRLRTGSGTDWAMPAVQPDDTPDRHDPGHAALLIRRQPARPPSTAAGAQARRRWPA
ncbi:transposase [Nonomuraea sp. NPDC052116]|uniref:transposase n=1 Tax=Nonomuraea sp. NPDC052116 TaxID=3155665 RepID=UPI0034224A80